MATNTIEQHYAVDVRQVMRACSGRTASLELSQGDKLYCLAKINTEKQTMQLNQQRVKLTTTPCNYGGKRWWFICPSCERRCAKLYWGNTWACQQCLNLKYYSQQATTGNCWTWYWKAEKVAIQIDPSFRITDALAAAHASWWDFPERPKGMHWNTYERMRTKFLGCCKRGGYELSRSSNGIYH